MNSTVLRLLAVGLPVADISERISQGPAPDFSTDDLRAVLAHAAVVAREASFLPPAQAAFFGRTLLPPAGPIGDQPGVQLSASELPALRDLAIKLIDQYLERESDSIEPPDPKHIPMHSASLQYLEALLRQEEIVDDLRQARLDESSLHAALTGTDRTRIEELLLNRGGTRLDSLVHRWQRFTGYVESRPDSHAFEDYEQGLRIRDQLQDAISVLTPRAREMLESHVRPADDRFFHATRSVSRSVRPASPWRAQGWWWYRLPRRLGKHFSDRLAHVAPTVAQEVSLSAGESETI